MHLVFCFPTVDVVALSSNFGEQQGREYLRTLIEVGQKVKQKSLVYYHEGTVSDVSPPDPSVTIELATEPLVERVVSDADRREKFSRFLRDGHIGLLAHDGDDLVARGWICPPEATSVPYSLPGFVGDLDVYWLFHARTYADYRQRGWHTYMVARRLAWIYDQEPNAWVFTDIAPDNVSRYTFASTGFVPAGKMTTYRLGHPTVGVKQFGRWEPTADHPPLPDKPQA